MKNFIFFCFLFVWCANSFAQQTQWIGDATDQHKPLLVVVLPQEAWATTAQKMQTSAYVSQAYGLLIQSSMHVAAAKDSLNQVLNEKPTILLQKVYLVTVGETDEKFAKLGKDFIAQHENFTLIEWQKIDLTDLLTSYSRHYTWKIAIENIEQNHASDIARNKQEGGVGLTYNLHLTQQANSKDYVPDFFSSYSLLGYYRIDKQWQAQGELSFGYSTPDREGMQKEMQSKLDITKIMSGESQKIHVKTTLSSHVFLRLGTEIIRFWQPQSTFRPYVGLGLSGSMLMGMRMTIDTTMTISSANMQGGFGGGTPPAALSGANAPKINTLVSFVPTAGFVYELGEKINLVGNVKYNIDTNILDEYKLPTINNFSLSLGLTWRLRTKKKLFYDYVR